MALQIKHSSLKDNNAKRKVLEEVVKEDLTRVTVDINTSLYKGIKMLCITAPRKLKMKNVINEAVEEYLNKYLKQ